MSIFRRVRILACVACCGCSLGGSFVAASGSVPEGHDAGASAVTGPDATGPDADASIASALPDAGDVDAGVAGVGVTDSGSPLPPPASGFPGVLPLQLDADAWAIFDVSSDERHVLVSHSKLEDHSTGCDCGCVPQGGLASVDVATGAVVPVALAATWAWFSDGGKMG